MWDTANGERVLRGNERQVFVTGVCCLRDALCDAVDDEIALCADWPETFEALPTGQKIIALAEVTKGLLDPKQPVTTVVAWQAATIAAVYAALEEEVRLELEYEAHDDTYADDTIRNELAPMLRGLSRDPDLELPSDMDDATFENWQFVIESCLDRINHDADYDLADLPDLEPTKRQTVGQLAGISQEYFSATPPVDTPVNVTAAKEYLAKL